MKYIDWRGRENICRCLWDTGTTERCEERRYFGLGVGSTLWNAEKTICYSSRFSKQDIKSYVCRHKWWLAPLGECWHCWDWTVCFINTTHPHGNTIGLLEFEKTERRTRDCGKFSIWCQDTVELGIFSAREDEVEEEGSHFRAQGVRRQMNRSWEFRCCFLTV